MDSENLQYIIYVAIFIIALLFVEGLYYLIAGSGKGEKAVNRRMKMLAAGGASREVLETLRRHRDNTAGAFGSFSLVGRLDRLIAQSGATVSVGRVFIIMGGGAVGLSLFLWLFLPVLPDWIVPFIGIPVGIIAPVLFFRFKKKRRIKKLSEQLPDALDLIVRSLRAGHPITTSLALVAREMRDPIGSEIGIVVDEMTYGLDFRDALENLRQRIPAPDLHYLVVTINIQHGTGGNLAEVLHNLSTVIRARYQMFAKIRALSAEGRISATVLSAIPFFVLGAVWLTTPGYYKNVMGDPLLPILAGTALAMELTAIGVMWKMVNFKV